MILRCDLHLHTCLSPCGAEEMTPNNIVGMAQVLELDVIAVTDHNSAGNCRAVAEAAGGTGLTVLSGLELCTAEEIHVVCLFRTPGEAEAFGETVYGTLPPISNRPGSFGRQVYRDAEDNETGLEERLLTTASSIPIHKVNKLVAEHGGVAWPAHVDRPSYSVLSVLGDYPADLGFPVAELSRYADEEALRRRYPALGGVRRLRASDAHDLESMVLEPPQTIRAGTHSPRGVLEALRQL